MDIKIKKWEINYIKWKNILLMVKKMFFGEFENTLDIKGRVSIPAKFREEIGDVFYISPGLNNSLLLYPEAEFEDMYSSISSLSATNPSALAFTRIFNSITTKCEFDKLGRVGLSKVQIDFAKIGKEIIFIGMDNRIEIWSKDIWTRIKAQSIDYDSLVEELSRKGLRFN